MSSENITTVQVKIMCHRTARSDPYYLKKFRPFKVTDVNDSIQYLTKIIVVSLRCDEK